MNNHSQPAKPPLAIAPTVNTIPNRSKPSDGCCWGALRRLVRTTAPARARQSSASIVNKLASSNVRSNPLKLYTRLCIDSSIQEQVEDAERTLSSIKLYHPAP